MPLYNQRRDLYTSKSASEITSETYWVGDAVTITLQIVGSPSTTTVRGSNDDGRDAAISNWTALQTLTSADIYSIEPGIRWIQLQRSGTTNAILNLETRL